MFLCTDCSESLLFCLSLSFSSFVLFCLGIDNLLRIALDGIPGKNIFIFSTFLVIWKIMVKIRSLTLSFNEMNTQ